MPIIIKYEKKERFERQTVAVVTAATTDTSMAACIHYLCQNDSNVKISIKQIYFTMTLKTSRVALYAFAFISHTFPQNNSNQLF